MRKFVTLFAALATLAAMFAPAAKAASPAVFHVGAAVEDITPHAMPCDEYPGPCFPDDKGVWLGGYGLGAAGRQSSGVVDHRISARGMVISNSAGATLAFGMNETQGMFAAYQQGPFGLDDARRQINKATGIPMNHIVLGSDHSHSGPDTTFVWGGVPDNYLKFIHDQLIKAVVEAWQASQTQLATLWVGQWDDLQYTSGLGIPGLPDQDYSDKTIRVLQARGVDGDTDGRAIVTFVEAPFHPTSYGSSHDSSSPSSIDSDWPGRVADWAANTYGGLGLGWEGDIGRQSSDGGEVRIEAAAANAIQHTMAPITDDTIDGRVQLMTEEITNPVYIWFLNGGKAAAPVTCTTGDPTATPAYGQPPALQGGGVSLCSPVPRANTPPYGGVATSGLWATTFRIGDVLISGGPGEVYPNLAETVRLDVPRARHFYLGLAQDQVGYIIGPAKEWPIIVANRDAAGNDNGLFNGGPTIGDHLVCEHILAANSMGFDATIPPECIAETASDPASSALAAQYGLS